MRQRQNAQKQSGKFASQDSFCAFCLHCNVSLLNKFMLGRQLLLFYEKRSFGVKL